MLSLYDTWRNKFGVLLFLYSVILTKVELYSLTHSVISIHVYVMFVYLCVYVLILDYFLLNTGY